MTNSVARRRREGLLITKPRLRHLTKCPLSGKVRFRDKSEAVDALHRSSTSRHFAALDGRSSARQECRSYPCNACHGWHVTSWAAFPHASAA